MTRSRFLKERRPAWRRFESLLKRTERFRVRGLTGRDLSEFSRLFRALSYDLATVRSRDWGQDLERYLNDLVTRGHNSFYRPVPGRFRDVVRFLSERFPRLVRENVGYFIVSLALFAVPGVVSGVVVSRDPSVATRILPGTTLVLLESMYSDERERSGGTGAEAGMAGFYVRNNISIAFRCFALGIFLGAGTAFILVQNGVFLGTATGYIVAKGYSDRFFSFVISHGSFELTAIVVSGAAGLVLGRALLHPGELDRLESLRQRGRVSLQLAAGAGVMLAIAACIEAFWSPMGVPGGWKYGIGAMLWVLVVLYFVLAGRKGANRA